MSATTLDTQIRHAEATRKAPPPPGSSRYRFAALTVCSIWAALAAASIWSPELVSGSDQTHVPIAAFSDWFYAVIATGLVLMAFGRRTPDVGRSSWSALPSRSRRSGSSWRSSASGPPTSCPAPIPPGCRSAPS